MGRDNMDVSENELLTARASFGVAQDRWLLADPLRFLGVELSADAIREDALEGSSTLVDVDIVTKPKPGGGVRTELFPDFLTSVLLQVIADRVSETLTDPSDSLSVRLFGIRLQGESPYDVWGSAVAAWMRTELEAGRVVIVCDLSNFFSTIRRDQIEAALVGRVAEHLALYALRVLDAIHAACKNQGRPTTGLPVSPADFFWLVADLVLYPLDRDIRQGPGVMAYARWVDDLFVSTSPWHIDQVIDHTETAAGRLGFRLNHQKTRVLRSLDQFRSEFHVSEHETLSHLFSTLDRGHRMARPEALINDVRRNVLGTGIEEARLIKRIYGVAALMGSPTLIDTASADLARFPTAERPILDYVGGQGWPEGRGPGAIATIESATTDSRAILALRSLLNSSLSTGHRTLFERLEWFALNDDSGVHPYARAVMAAVLAKHAEPDRFTAFAENVAARVGTWKSSLARRVAYEFLSLASGPGPWVPRLATDSSSLVRPLSQLLMGVISNAELATLRAVAEQRRPRRLAWGEMDSQLSQKIIATAPV